MGPGLECKWSQAGEEGGVGCYLRTGFSRRLQDRRLVGAGVGGQAILQESRGGRTSREQELRRGRG